MALTLLTLALLAGTACSSPLVNRISGGQELTIDYIPFIVQVESLGPNSGIWSQSGAGSVLTSTFILTSASFFSGSFYDIHMRRIRAGTATRGRGGQIAYPYYAYVYPTFGENDMDADICVVHLDWPLEYTPYVQQGAILPQDYVIPDYYDVDIAGWGATEAGGPPSENLRSGTVFILNNEECAAIYSQINRNITSNMICTGGCRCKSCCAGNIGACEGDAGGPMFIGHIITGIQSFAQGCGDGALPTVATSVAKFSNWIVNVAQ